MLWRNMKSDSGGGRRARLELLFVPMSESGECSAESELNVLAIAVAVPIAVLVILIIVIVLAVPKIRKDVPNVIQSNVLTAGMYNIHR